MNGLTRVITTVDADTAAPATREEPGTVYYRELEDGRCIAVFRLIMGTVRVAIGPTGVPVYDDAWCYDDPVAGILAASCWDGHGDPPEGWFRHVGSGRRRENGDPARETVRW